MGLKSLYGVHDENLKLLEDRLGVHISARGNRLIMKGDPINLKRAEKIIKEFAELKEEGYRIKPDDFVVALRLISNNEDIDIAQYFLNNKIFSSSKKHVTPKSLNQKEYIEAIKKYDIVFGVGPAGTGKTYLAMAMALATLNSKLAGRIILTRPAIEVGEKLGFLPGNLLEKVNPYLRPLYDALYDLTTVEKVHKLLERGYIEIAPIGFMRGRTLSDSFVILDEAQNSTSEQMKMFLTRIGLNSKVVITGDITQVDLPSGKKSGLKEAIKILSYIEGLRFVYFDENDVVRHDLVQKIIVAYEKYEKDKT